MTAADKHLVVKRSGISGAGKGLFTKIFIPRGTVISEYKGKVTTWKDADHDDGKNAYIFYLNRNHVIDGRHNKRSLAQYANDSKGLVRMQSGSNNAKYVSEGKRVFIQATRDIEAGEEILVSYGKEYWDTIRKYKKEGRL